MSHDLITRAREYIKDKYLDVADVPAFIKAYVELYDENKDLIKLVKELKAEVASLQNEIDYRDSP